MNIVLKVNKTINTVNAAKLNSMSLLIHLRYVYSSRFTQFKQTKVKEIHLKLKLYDRPKTKPYNCQ